VKLPLLLLLPLTACATAPTVYPFGPGSYTTHAFGIPLEARTQAVKAASQFCLQRGLRSLPSDLTVVALPNQHSVTIVFACVAVGPKTET